MFIAAVPMMEQTQLVHTDGKRARYRLSVAGVTATTIGSVAGGIATTTSPVGDV